MSEESATETVEEQSSSGTKILVVVAGVVAVLCLICIVVFAMLTILGPQIGNVFSQITYTLDNPAPGVWLRGW